MSQTLPLPPPGFESLTVEEQIDYVQSLWDHIAAQPEQVPVPDWHKEILRERRFEHHCSISKLILFDFLRWMNRSAAHS